MGAAVVHPDCGCQLPAPGGLGVAVVTRPHKEDFWLWACQLRSRGGVPAAWASPKKGLERHLPEVLAAEGGNRGSVKEWGWLDLQSRVTISKVNTVVTQSAADAQNYFLKNAVFPLPSLKPAVCLTLGSYAIFCCSAANALTTYSLNYSSSGSSSLSGSLTIDETQAPTTGGFFLG